MRIPVCRRLHLLRSHTECGGYAIKGFENIRTFIPLPSEGHGSKIWCIRLKEQMVETYLRQSIPEFAGVLECYNSVDAEHRIAHLSDSPYISRRTGKTVENQRHCW